MLTSSPFFFSNLLLGANRTPGTCQEPSLDLDFGCTGEVRVQRAGDHGRLSKKYAPAGCSTQVGTMNFLDSRFLCRCYMFLLYRLIPRLFQGGGCHKSFSKNLVYLEGRKAKRRSIRPILHASVTGTTENISVKAEAYLKDSSC